LKRKNEFMHCVGVLGMTAENCWVYWLSGSLVLYTAIGRMNTRLATSIFSVLPPINFQIRKVQEQIWSTQDGISSACVTTFVYDV
jgi:hypothetical protein